VEIETLCEDEGVSDGIKQQQCSLAIVCDHGATSSRTFRHFGLLKCVSDFCVDPVWRHQCGSISAIPRLILSLSHGTPTVECCFAASLA
jgi:hypothetical protein